MYQDALLDEMGRPRGMGPREQGGIMGQRAQAPPLQAGPDLQTLGGGPDWRNPGGTTATGPEPPAPSPQGLGNFAGKLEGFDQGKLGSGHDSPKYQFGRAMSQFDPKGGISQELLDALNALGLGNVTGGIGGDKISIGNADPRFEGVTEFDIIRDLENGGGWQWGGLNGKAAQPQGAPGMGGNRPGLGGGVNTLMQDPSSAIAAALAQSRTPNIEALLAQLAGGQ